MLLWLLLVLGETVTSSTAGTVGAGTAVALNVSSVVLLVSICYLMVLFSMLVK